MEKPSRPKRRNPPTHSGMHWFELPITCPVPLGRTERLRSCFCALMNARAECGGNRTATDVLRPQTGFEDWPGHQAHTLRRLPLYPDFGTPPQRWRRVRTRISPTFRVRPATSAYLSRAWVYFRWSLGGRESRRERSHPRLGTRSLSLPEPPLPLRWPRRALRRAARPPRA